jgi:hypothetical protein
MKFANATKFDRKSGVAQGRDLQFLFRTQRMCRGRLTSGFHFSVNANCRTIRDDKVDGDGPPWHVWNWMDTVNQRGSPGPLTLPIDYQPKANLEKYDPQPSLRD